MINQTTKDKIQAQKGVKPIVTANKAKRQTTPAFRMREKWMIAEEFMVG